MNSLKHIPKPLEGFRTNHFTPGEVANNGFSEPWLCLRKGTQLDILDSN